MVDRDHPRCSISRQCRMLGLARSTWYHRPTGEKVVNLDLMRRIDEQFLETPFYGSRQMHRHGNNQGIVVGRARVRRLMRKMGRWPFIKNQGPASRILSARFIRACGVVYRSIDQITRSTPISRMC
ncbi:transposase [Desulfovibrio sulfodismutans]|uniref:Transposase n=1 Tax=Desulfolutivibrio sulfodismutans TaxID=63561 RepID=A0A7K3NJJ7_9BACT|nr:IS3 family transposase [Desulfolutivibrio sulfodismutans]NDY56374.1 transposase [Desulfolutivibrio sulfodismutans]QLA13455.1 IS3 family transposase [Desulfolutivibrio sulfodismutans DSM 3696]